MAKTPKAREHDPRPDGPSDAVEHVDPKSLRPDPDQPRQHRDPEAIADLAASVAQLGIINPVEADGDGVIVTGELRWRAAVEAGLKTVPVRRLTGLAPEQRFLRQLIENLQHNELGDQDVSGALAHLRDLRRRDLLPGPEVSVSKRDRKPKGRPPGYAPGSVRELAAIVGKSKDWVGRHISDTFVEAEDVPEKLRAALADDRNLHPDAVASIRRRCPERYREALIDQVADQATRGFIATRGVQAVVNGLREVAQTKGDGETAARLIDLVQANERGSFIAAQVKVVTPKTPEERRADQARGDRAFARALDEARRQLRRDMGSAKGHSRKDEETADRVEALRSAAVFWLIGAGRAGVDEL